MSIGGIRVVKIVHRVKSPGESERNGIEGGFGDLCGIQNNLTRSVNCILFKSTLIVKMVFTH